MRNIATCGQVRLYDGTSTELVFDVEDDGTKNLYFFDEMSGINIMYGFKDLEFVGTSNEFYKEDEEYRQSDEYNRIISLTSMKLKLRNDIMAVAVIRGGLLCIKDVNTGEGFISCDRVNGESITYSEYIGTGTIEYEDDGFTEVCDYLNIEA